ncbi:lipase family protein [Nocardia tengchongensis]|uniref:lipase family protein n=1 Tax=Nocardia tengchongensis TaxID=2055889 RepID=UPI003669C3CC
MKQLTAVLVVLGLSITMGQTAARVEADPPEPPVPVAPSVGVPGVPNPLQQWIDDHVPAPTKMVPHAARPLAAPGDLPPELTAFWTAVQSPPTGDPMFDAWPADLAEYAPGDILDSRDVTESARPTMLLLNLTGIARATLLKFRTTNSAGEPSIGTATLVLPPKAWSGPGPQPVLVNAPATNSLNKRCTPGYVLSHGMEVPTGNDFTPSPTTWALDHGYALIIPDHEGPLMAYSEPSVAGHNVLDSMRAVRHFAPDQFGESRFATTGYSGGAIASNAAAMLVSDYAPELLPQFAGASFGGLVNDYRRFAHTFDGSYISAFLLSTVLAVGREHPEILGLMNHAAQWLATSPIKDNCSGSFGALGIAPIPIDTMARVDKSLDSAAAETLFQELSMQGRKSGVPLFIYHGISDPWIPVTEAEQLWSEQCALGVAATKNIVGGEHLAAYVSSYAATMDWLDQRLRGEPATGTCPATPARR